MGRLVYMESYEDYIKRMGQSAPSVDRKYLWCLVPFIAALLILLITSFYESSFKNKKEKNEEFQNKTELSKIKSR